LPTSLLGHKTESRPEQVRAVPAEVLDVFGQLAVPELRGLVPAYAIGNARASETDEGLSAMGNPWFKIVWTSIAFIGATYGAAGWILGAGEQLASAGHGTDAALVRLCAAGVLLSGGIMWVLWLAGRRLNLFVVIELLLGASFTFGLLALWIMRVRGVVALAIDSSGGYPEGLAYAAPIALLAIMAILCWSPIRKRLQRTRP